MDKIYSDNNRYIDTKDEKLDVICKETNCNNSNDLQELHDFNAISHISKAMAEIVRRYNAAINTMNKYGISLQNMRKGFSSIQENNKHEDEIDSFLYGYNAKDKFLDESISSIKDPIYKEKD